MSVISSKNFVMTMIVTLVIVVILAIVSLQWTL